MESDSPALSPRMAAAQATMATAGRRPGVSAMSSTDVNVKVAVRCRPMNARELQMGAETVVRVVDGTSVILQSALMQEEPKDIDAASSKKQFTFDFAYFIESTQQQVYDDIAKPIVDQALQGYNGTIFAYGQTGSGKTHTMMGSGDDHGIIPMMNNDLFRRLDENTNGTTKFLITVSYLEIYNEVIKDLLNPSDKVLKIREHPDMGIYVEQLAELVVKEPNEVTRLLEQGNKVRQVAATQMNERSSRSHSCFTLKIASKTVQELNGLRKETTMNAKINLVDLAGSERASKTGATGDRLKEGAAINKSLSSLGNVINMLADKTKKAGHHVPYRDSKLTRLLQESLGGNSLTVMIAAISPADYNYEETLSTLLYANRAKSIKNATKKNEDVNEKLIRELREEIERLRQMVRPTSASSSAPQQQQQQSPVSSEAMAKMEETIANLERAKQQSWEEKQRLTELYEQERLNALNNDKKILGFMQTVKQEKADAIKRLKSLQQDKSHKMRALRTHKESYGTNKTKLQKQVEDFQALQKQVVQLTAIANTSAVSAADVAKRKQSEVQLQTLLGEMDGTKRVVLDNRDAMAALKEEIKQLDQRIVEEEAEMAAKATLLDQDDQLRKAIQQDEREKMQLEKEAFLAQALESERAKLEQQAEDEKLRLQQALEATADKEHKLLQEVELQRHKNMALQEQLYQFKLRQKQERQQLREMLQEIIKEKDILESKFVRAVQLLHGTKEDLHQVLARNDELEKQVQLLERQRLLLWE